MSLLTSKKKKTAKKSHFPSSKDNNVTAEDRYPEEINPFGSQEILNHSPKGGKIKSKKKGKGDEGYPNEINPFLDENNKERKKREKKEKKQFKKQMKNEKKLAKKQKKINLRQTSNPVEVDVNESFSAKANLNKENIASNEGKADETVADGGRERMVLEKKVSRTLDFRDKAKPYDKILAPSRRVQELKSGGSRPTGKLRASLPDLTQDSHYSSYRNNNQKTKSLENILDLDEKSNITQQAPVSKAPPQSTSRPLSLEINRQDFYKNCRTLSPVKEEKSPSPTKTKHLKTSQDVKMYRTSSVSKKGKDKRKMKLLAKRLKKKRGRKATVIEDTDGVDQVVMRRPKVNIEALRRDVEEVQQSARTSIINLVEQRNSALDLLTESTKELEEFSYGFAQIAKENRLKNQARVTCCGLGVRWKICWYICACEGKTKRKKREKAKATEVSHPAESETQYNKSHNLLDQDDDDDYYKLASTKDETYKEQLPGKQSNRHSSSSSIQPLGRGDRISTSSAGSKGKFFKLPFRSSMPQLDQISNGGTLRRMAQIDPRERKSSSVNALHEIVKKRGEKKRRQRQEKDIVKFASQYDDAVTRKKVEELLKLDM